MLRKIRLHGALKKYSKDVIEMDGNNIRILISGLCSAFGNQFKQLIRTGQFHIVKGKLHKKDVVSHETLEMELGNTQEIHILPYIEGSKNGGVMQRIIGAVLIVVGVIIGVWAGWTGFGAQVAANLIVAGIGMMLMSLMVPKPQSNEKADERASFIFNGAVNTMEQGGAIPLVYGICRCGSAVVSAGVDTVRVFAGMPTRRVDAAPNSAWGIINV